MSAPKPERLNRLRSRELEPREKVTFVLNQASSHRNTVRCVTTLKTTYCENK